MGKWDLEEVSVDYSMYERELKERQHVIESCPIDVYCSGINPRFGYTHRLMSYNEARSSVAEAAGTVMIDSGYRQYGEMKRLLEAVEKVDADYFILPDITPYFYCYEDIEPENRVLEYARHLKRYDRKDLECNVLVPLHKPFEESVEAMLDPDLVAGEDNYIPEGQSLLEYADGVAIGLKEMPVPDRIRTLEMINTRIPEHKHVHALSPGTEMEMLAFLRENPHMVDSIDVSTPENAPGSNKIPDARWNQHMAKHHKEGHSWFPTGTDVSTLRAVASSRIALQLNYMLSDLCDDSEFSEYASSESETLVADD